MKKSKAETAETRKRILETASEAFRVQGIDATGVAEIMSAAGLTHGGFYRHFASKDQLVSEAIAVARKDFVADTESAAASRSAKAVMDVFQDYVTPGYRDDVGSGCVFAANGSELARADDQTRHVATVGFRRIVDAAAPFMRPGTGEDLTDASIGAMTSMIGALTMARIVDDPALSDRILAIAHRRLAAAFEVPEKKPRRDREKKLA